MSSFAAQVAALSAELSAAEARVARFMAEHPHRVGHLSAARLAEAAGVSDATVIRTVRRLGFDGLAALRESLAAELSMSGRLEASLASSTSADGPMRLVAERIDAVTALPGRIGEESLVRAVDAVSAAERVCTAAFGPARHLAEYAAHQFGRVGTDSVALGGTGRGFADDLLRLRAGDAVVLLAYDGVSVETDALFERADDLGLPVVQFSEDPLTADTRATVVLAAGRGDPLHSPSHAATIIVLEALVLASASRHPDRADRAAHLLHGLRQRLTRSPANP